MGGEHSASHEFIDGLTELGRVKADESPQLQIRKRVIQNTKPPSYLDGLR
jgi:hypothetical protein